MIPRKALLKLIEENSPSKGLDLSGARLVSDLVTIVPRGQFEDYWRQNDKLASMESISGEEALRLLQNQDSAETFEGSRLTDDQAEEEFYACRQGIDLSPEALAPLAEAYRSNHDGSDPPWFRTRGGINVSGRLLDDLEAPFANLQGANFSGCSMKKIQLENSDLRGASFSSGDMEGAYLSGADLRGAELHGTSLHAAILYDTRMDDVSLYAASLERVDMYRVNGLANVDWGEARLDHTLITRAQLGGVTYTEAWAKQLSAPDVTEKARKAESYVNAAEVYLRLKSNFIQIGRYGDAAWANIKEQQMRKMAEHWKWREHGWRFWRRSERPYDEMGYFPEERVIVPFLRWLRSWAYELVTGYGERPSNPVIGGAFVIIGFGFGFWLTRAVSNLLDAMTYSMATFATFNLSRQELNPEGIGAEVASSAEALLGIGILALFVFTLGNRMSRG